MNNNYKTRFDYSFNDPTTYIEQIEKLLNQDIVGKNRSYFDECLSLGLSPLVSVELFLSNR